ncbi:MAG: serine hydrolase [Acidobacteriaceae bacterium]
MHCRALFTIIVCAPAFAALPQTAQPPTFQQSLDQLIRLTAVLQPAAQPQTPQQALARLLTGGPVQAGWFDASFLAQIPLGQVQQIVTQYTTQYGKFQRIDGSSNEFTVYTEHASFPAKAYINTQGQFTGLWFGLAQPMYATLDDSLKPFTQLPGKVSLLVLDNGRTRASLHPDEALAVGSAFKLAVITALNREIVAGKHRWDEVIPLNPAWKTLPSGVIRTWPDSTPITLATYANQMISISDNTAADALLAITGRAQVEAASPRNTPFLSTREAFILKDPANAALLARWRGADTAGKRALLPEIDKLLLPDVSVFDKGPVGTDVEWFFTPAELCTLIDGVRDLGAMQINPGVTEKRDWERVAYKGGSEPGVLNLTTAMTGKNGHHYCVAATWNNDAALDENQFFSLYKGVLASLASEPAK